MGECTNSACERITHTFASAMHGMTKLTSSSTIVLSASFNISTSSPSCWYVVVAGSYVCVRVCVCVCVCVLHLCWVRRRMYAKAKHCCYDDVPDLAGSEARAQIGCAYAREGVWASVPLAAGVVAAM